MGYFDKVASAMAGVPEDDKFLRRGFGVILGRPHDAPELEELFQAEYGIIDKFQYALFKGSPSLLGRGKYTRAWTVLTLELLREVLQARQDAKFDAPAPIYLSRFQPDPVLVPRQSFLGQPIPQTTIATNTGAGWIKKLLGRV